MATYNHLREGFALINQYREQDLNQLSLVLEIWEVDLLAFISIGVGRGIEAHSVIVSVGLRNVFDGEEDGLCSRGGAQDLDNKLQVAGVLDKGSQLLSHIFRVLKVVRRGHRWRE